MRILTLLILVACRSAWAAGNVEHTAISGNPKERPVTFTTTDNLVIHAGYTTPSATSERAPIVILLHMYRSDRSEFEPLIPQLQAAGFVVLAIDLRGHGQSVNAPEIKLTDRVSQRDSKLFAAMVNDVEAGYEWLAEQPGVDLSRVALVGASVGSSVALQYAAKDKSVDAVVCLTPGTSYLGLDSLAAVEKYGHRQLLLIAAEPERSAADQLGRACPGAVLKIVPYNGPDQGLHGARMFGKVPGIEKEIASFLTKALGPPTREVVMASLKGQVYYVPEASMATHLSKQNVRYFSSPAEAEQRGLHPPRSGGARRTGSRSTKGKTAMEGESFPTSPRP